MMSARASQLSALRARVASTEGWSRRHGGLSLGDARVDACLPEGGLPLGRWHEVAGEGGETDASACTAAFVSVLTARLAQRGEAVWVLQRADLHAPGAAALGLRPDRLLFVQAGDDAEALAALEDALRTPGVAAAAAEVDRLDLVAGRRLQLACERGGTGFVVRRRLFGRPHKEAVSGAATRWRVSPAPSEPGPEPGLGPPRWRVRLERCQGGRSGGWIMEASDEAYPLRVVAELADHELAPAQRRRAVG